MIETPIIIAVRRWLVSEQTFTEVTSWFLIELYALARLIWTLAFIHHLYVCKTRHSDFLGSTRLIEILSFQLIYQLGLYLHVLGNKKTNNGFKIVVIDCLTFLLSQRLT